jgi:ribosomal protein L5
MPLTAAATTALGIKEQLIFPEIEYDKIDKPSAAWTSCNNVDHRKTDEEGRELLKPHGRSVSGSKEGKTSG